MRDSVKIYAPGPRLRWIWGIAALAAAVILQGLAVRLALDHFSAGAGFLVLALASAIVLVTPGAASKVAASVAALSRRLAWWHGLWLLLLLSDLVFRIRDAAEIQDAPVDFWAAYRIVLVASAGFVLLARVVAGKHQWVRSLWMGLVRALAIYCAISMVSTAWSVFPMWTLYKSIEYFVDVAVLAAILVQVKSMEGFKSLFDWTWMLMSGLVATVWIGAVIWPSLAFSHDVGAMWMQLSGVLPSISANGVGELAAVLATVALSRILLRSGPGAGRGFYALMLAVTLATLLLSQTRSALMALIFGAAVLLFLSRRVGITTFLAVLVVLVVIETPATDVLWKYFRRGQDQYRFETLSGRTQWWSAGWQKYLDRPYTGYGGYAGGRFATLAEMREGATSSLHNAYFEVLLGTGPAGLVVVVTALAGTWWLLLRAVRAPAGMTLERQLTLEALGVLAVVTLRSVFTTHLIWHPSLSFLLVLGYAEFLRRRRRGLIRLARAIKVSA